jgi:hypothetical protein
MIYNTWICFEFTVSWIVYVDIIGNREKFLIYVWSLYSEKNYDNMFIISVNEIVGDIQDA